MLSRYNTLSNSDYLLLTYYKFKCYAAVLSYCL